VKLSALNVVVVFGGVVLNVLDVINAVDFLNVIDSINALNDVVSVLLLLYLRN